MTTTTGPIGDLELNRAVRALNRVVGLLQSARLQAHALLDAIPDSLFIVDGAGIVLYRNAAAESMVGRGVESGPGRYRRRALSILEALASGAP